MYTRDGAFKVSASEEGSMFVTAEGYPLLDTEGNAAVIPPEVAIKDVSVAEDGTLSYMDAEGVRQDLDVRFMLVQFSNPQGLEAIGSNLLAVTASSGAPIVEADADLAHPSRMHQGVLEMSNVQVAEEMVNLIVAQRAYDLNSKAITTSDEMLQTANSLKR
jgi:flagellar basal-body rod protein FlgG